MANRGQKRTEAVDALPADKRACSSLEFRPSSSNSSNQTTLSSAPEAQDADMETSSYTSTSSPWGGDGDKDSSTRGSCDSSNSNHDSYNTHHSPGEQSRIKKLLSSLREEGEESGQLARLTELCESLSFCHDDSLSSSMIDSLSPLLVSFARHESNDEIMLLALRSINYMCDVNPRSTSFLVRHDAVPALCQRLVTIEYLDVAEQCLQALEKISNEHPLACLQSGVIMAVLTYIDFFSTSTQRIALSTLVNICKKLSPESLSHFMEAVPILCNLLQYEDGELVESVAICLNKIVEQALSHSDLLDEMCRHGLIEHAINLIGFDTRTGLSSKTLMSLVELLAKLAAGSSAAVRTLLQLNISSTIKNMLFNPSPSHGAPSALPLNGHKSRMHQVLRLLNALLPAITTEQDAGRKSEEVFLLENPEVINKLGTDILPALIQVVNSGVNMFICYGCLSVIYKFIHFSTSEALSSLLQSADFPSFLAGVFTRKDLHVILLGLHIVNTTMSKLSHVYMGPFVKEGVVFAINALVSTDEERPPLSVGIKMEGYPLPGHTHQGKLRCPCFEFEARRTLKSQEMMTCTIQKEKVQDLGRHILSAYFEAEPFNPEKGGTDVLRKLRKLSDSFIVEVNKSVEAGVSDQQEDEAYFLVQQIISELNKKDSVSTFEFIQSRVVEALAFYLLSGRYPSGMGSMDDANLVYILDKKFEAFGRLLLSSSDSMAPEDLPLLKLIRRLQSALLFVEDFPVVTINIPKHKNSYALVPYGCCNTYPSLRVRFVREESDVSLSKYAEDIVTVDPFVPVNEIEGYLWKRVSNDEANNMTSVSKVPVVRSSSGGDSQIDSSTPEHRNADSSAKMLKEILDLPSQSSGLSSSEHKGADPADARTVDVDHLDQEFSTVQTDDRVDVDSTEFINVDDTSEKLLLYLEGKKIDGKLSLYQSIIKHENETGQNSVQSSHLWMREYNLVYRRGKVTKERLAKHHYDAVTSFSSSRATSIVKDTLLFSRMFLSRTKFGNLGSACDILFLLKILEGVHRYGFHVMLCEGARAFSGGRMNDVNNAQYNMVFENEFVNKKLTEKLEQLVCDPMAVSVGAMPAWCTELITWFPFLFGFKARCKYFYLSALHRSPNSVSLFSSRHLGGLDVSQQSYRNITKKKFVVHRDRVLESTVRMMELYVRHKVPLEVEFNEEVGTGLGPMLEFYTLVCQEFQKVGLYMWRGDTLPHQCSTVDQAQNSGSWPPPFGLFPRPWSPLLSTSSSSMFSEVVDKFRLLGQMVAKAIEDERVLDFPFSKPFYKCVIGKELNVHDILSFDPALGKVLLDLLDVVRLNRYSKVVGDEKEKNADVGSLLTKIEDLYLDFSLPGYPDYQFVEESESNMVNLDNLEKYISLVIDATIKSGIARQVEAFKAGFNQVFNIRHLKVFREEELEHLLCGEHVQWNSDSLLDHIKFDHGYTINSPPVVMLLEILREFNSQQQRAFLQFITGATRLPTGGLASLNPKLTIVRKHCSKGTDAELPSVMTCANYVKLPPYSSKDIMKEKLLYAITEGQGSFHLS